MFLEWKYVFINYKLQLISIILPNYSLFFDDRNCKVKKIIGYLWELVIFDFLLFFIFV